MKKIEIGEDHKIPPPKWNIQVVNDTRLIIDTVAAIALQAGGCPLCCMINMENHDTNSLH